MTRTLWPVLAGFVIWCLAFVGLYALQALGCHLGWNAALHRAVLIGTYGLTLAVLAALLTVQIVTLRQRKVATAVERIGIGTTVAALASNAIIFAPSLLISACH